MDAWFELSIRIRLEVLVSEREGMIAENKHREHCGQSMAYCEDSFLINAQKITELNEELRKHG